MRTIKDDVTAAIPARGNRAPKKKLEKDIQREICDWLASQKVFFWRSNNVPVFERSNGKARFRSLPKYTPRGLPDIMSIIGGQYIGLEVKVPDYWKFTDEQKMMKQKILENGGFYYLVTSLGEAMDAMSVHAPYLRVS